MLFLDYLPAELKANKSRWYVAYHVKNPQTGKLHRRTIKVNRIENLTERRKFARKLVLDINDKLHSGWNPFVLEPRITKDKDDRIVTISEELITYLEKLNIGNIAKENYIYSKKFKPGKILKNTRDIGRCWEKLRKELKMPAVYQFYSLKDTGIVRKIRDGISLIDIHDQAGHSSLEQLEEYTIYANPEGRDQIKGRSSGF
jgi:integrase